MAPSSTTAATSVNSSSVAEKTSERLVSLDALRGFDMLLIVAGDKFVSSLSKASASPPAQWLAHQFTHSPWEGFTFYDFIFPLFVFLVGVSLVFSLDKAVERGGARGVVGRVARRSLLLFLWGVFYNGGLARGWRQVRWMGVLQRIAIAYLFGAIIYLACSRRALRIAAVAVLILIGYAWLLQTAAPPDQKLDLLQPGHNISNYVDRHYLPGRLHERFGDPEGVLSSIPAIATCLLGALAGLLIKNKALAPGRKVALLLAIGLLLVLDGYAWSIWLPIIKKLWTPSYVLVAGGYSFILVGLFYLVIDVWKIRRPAAPFEWVGCNALAIYLVAEVVNLPRLSEHLIGPDLRAAIAPWGDMAVTFVSLTIVLIFARFLYQRRIFLRV